MRWKRTLQLVDVHCEGEIGRVVTGGHIDAPGRTMADKLHHINTVDASLRLLLTREPRGGPAGTVVLLTPPTRDDADVGLIILQSDQAHAMSGSNTMCATTALLETGMIEMREPETTVTFDTAVGLVEAVAACRDGKCESVTLDMPPSFVDRLDAVVETEDWGKVGFDIAFGGVYYALIDVSQIDLGIEPASARDLAKAGMRLLSKIRNDIHVVHPQEPEVSGVAYVMFRDVGDDGTVRTCTTLKPGRVDRSPCGTGSNANIACMFARGQIKPGETQVSISITGSAFTTRFIKATQVDGIPHTHNQVTGRCWIHGMSQVGLDPSDPFPEGFVLSDTWGVLAGSD